MFNLQFPICSPEPLFTDSLSLGGAYLPPERNPVSTLFRQFDSSIVSVRSFMISHPHCRSSACAPGTTGQIPTSKWVRDPIMHFEAKETRGLRETAQVTCEWKTKLKLWRRGSDLNRRMEVLQTSPLGLLGTAPELRSITKLKCTCQWPGGNEAYMPLVLAPIFRGSWPA